MKCSTFAFTHACNSLAVPKMFVSTALTVSLSHCGIPFIAAKCTTCVTVFKSFSVMFNTSCSGRSYPFHDIASLSNCRVKRLPKNPKFPVTKTITLNHSQLCKRRIVSQYIDCLNWPVRLYHNRMLLLLVLFYEWLHFLNVLG